MDYKKAFLKMAELADVAVNEYHDMTLKYDAKISAYWLKQAIMNPERKDRYIHRLQTESICYRKYEIDLFLQEQGLIQSVNDNVL